MPQPSGNGPFSCSGWVRAFLPLAALLGLAVSSAAAQSQQANETPTPRQFLEAWNEADRLLGQTERIVTLWGEFADEHPDHALGRVARLNQALWTLRRIAEHNECLTDGALEPVLAMLEPPAADGQDPLHRHAHHAMLGLRARVQMLQLAEALRAYYARHVEYPETLAALVETELASEAQLTDPFGQPYEYTAEARAIMPDIPRQRFTLRCASIDATHDELETLLESLDQPIEDLQISSLVPERDQAYVRDRQRDGSWGVTRRWDVGQQPRDRRLWAVYDDYLLFAANQVPRVLRSTNDNE